MNGLRRLTGWRADLAALLLGLLSALALPPFHVIPVLLVSVPGLLILIDAARGVGGAARRGFVFGFGHHLLGLYWITEAILLESARYWWFVPIAVPSLSALLALFIAGPSALTKLVRPGWRRVVCFAGLWVLFDLARQFIGTGFPWNPWGSVWAIPGWLGDVMIQPAAWVGTPGLTLVTVLLAATPVLGLGAVSAAVVVVLLWAGAGWHRLSEPAPEPPGLAAVLVQGDVAQGQKWDAAVMRAAFERQLQLTRAGVARAGTTPSIVIWSETSVPYLLQYEPVARQMLAEAMAPARAALVGGLTFQAPPSRETLDTNPPYNSLLVVLPDGTIDGIYSKWHLVPFGEYAPSWVPLAIKIVPGNLGFGVGPQTLIVPGVPAFGPFICYEAVFPGQVIDENARPRFMVNITNDAWFGDSTGPRQHLAAARMRAVEEGLPLLRAANTGISAGFDARGHELGRITLDKSDFMTVMIPGSRPPTSFSRWGLAIPAILACLCAGAGVRYRRRSSNK